MPINKSWHLANKMPPKATLDQRITWHVAHQKNCNCRAITGKLAEEFKRRGLKINEPAKPTATKKTVKKTSSRKPSWNQKLLNANGLPKIVKLDKYGAKRWGGTSMAIPSPMEVNDLMAKVPKGKLTTTDDLRKSIARKYKTDIACPLTTGIFSWISANAAEEDRASGKKRFTPYWRTLKTGGIVNPKYPGGLEGQKKLLSSEGHKVIAKGKNLKVENYEKKLAKI